MLIQQNVCKLFACTKGCYQTVQFYDAADPESWHISGFKEIESSFKIKPVDVRDTDHVVRLKLRQRGGYGKEMWVKGAFFFSKGFFFRAM